MKKQKKKRVKKILLVPIIIVAVICAICAAGVLTLNAFLNRMNRVDEVVTVSPADEDFETDANNGLEEMLPEDVQWEKAESLNDDRLLNILLVGQDRRPGEGRQRSDAMIVISINPESKKVSMISFLRDLYVQIPGYSDNRLNAAYAFGGFPLLKSALRTNFGITIDGCFEVDFNGFKTLIDAIGGIDMYLTEAEATRMGHALSEGMNHLNGERALAYARIRKIGTDFGRTERQRKVLLAAFEKVKNRSVSDIISLINNVLPYLTTDMSNIQIYETAMKLIPMATSVQINTYYVPQEGMYTNRYIRGMDILFPNLSAIRDILYNEYLPF